MKIFDVAVVGGGPAGAVAAIELARRGRRVVLYDVPAVRRRKIGEEPPDMPFRHHRTVAFWPAPARNEPVCLIEN